MDPWQYEPARDLEQAPLDRLRNFPREPDMLVYGLRLAAALVTRGWLRVYHRLHVTGRENLPTDRSFVLVANHASHLDVLSLLAALPLGQVHRAFPAAARDYFFVHAPRLIAAAVVVNAMPFERRAGGRHSLALCQQVLEGSGNVLILFPEGTRSTTGSVAEFKPGIGLLLAGTSHPVVPCYLHGAGHAWPKGCWLPRPRPVKLIIGRARSYADLRRGRDSAERISEELREAVLAVAADGSTIEAPEPAHLGLSPPV